MRNLYCISPDGGAIYRSSARQSGISGRVYEEDGRPVVDSETTLWSGIMACPHAGELALYIRDNGGPEMIRPDGPDGDEGVLRQIGQLCEREQFRAELPPATALAVVLSDIIRLCRHEQQASDIAAEAWEWWEEYFEGLKRRL